MNRTKTSFGKEKIDYIIESIRMALHEEHGIKRGISVPYEHKGIRGRSILYTRKSNNNIKHLFIFIDSNRLLKIVYRHPAAKNYLFIKSIIEEADIDGVIHGWPKFVNKEQWDNIIKAFKL